MGRFDGFDDDSTMTLNIKLQSKDNRGLQDTRSCWRLARKLNYITIMRPEKCILHFNGCHKHAVLQTLRYVKDAHRKITLSTTDSSH